MINLLLLILGSIGIVLAAERYSATRSAMQKLAQAYAPGTCRSFILDILFLLPLVGLLVEVTAKHIRKINLARPMLYIVAIVIFLAISGPLYFDYFNFYFLTPFLGYPEAWDGNHFMWNSGIEVLGLRPFVDTTIPTYQNFWGFWNLLALFLFFVTYPLIMIGVGTRLYGLLFGYTEKQTGISALFFERSTR